MSTGAGKKLAADGASEVSVAATGNAAVNDATAGSANTLPCTAATHTGAGYTLTRSSHDQCANVLAGNAVTGTPIVNYTTGSYTATTGTATQTNGCVAVANVNGVCSYTTAGTNKTCGADSKVDDPASTSTTGGVADATGNQTGVDPKATVTFKCSSCMLGYTTTGANSTQGGTHTDQCYPCVNWPRTTTWDPAQSAALDKENCNATVCNAGAALVATNCVACDNLAGNGVVGHTGKSAADNANVAILANDCEVSSCSKPDYWYRNTGKTGCDRCANVNATGGVGDLVLGTKNAATGVWPVTTAGYETLIAGADKTACTVTCSTGYTIDATSKVCSICANLATNQANKENITVSGAAGAQTCAWACKAGYVASDGTGSASAPQNCVARTANFSFSTAAGVKTDLAGNAQTTAAAFGANSCATNKYLNAARYGVFFSAAGTMGAVTQTVKAADVSAADKVASDLGATATNPHLGPCAKADIDAYHFVDANAVYVCGRGRSRGSAGHADTTTANPTTTPAYTRDNPAICQAVASTAWGTVNRLGHDAHLTASAHSYDDASTTECNFNTWGFEETMKAYTNTQTELNGKTADAKCNQDVVDEAADYTVSATDNSVTFKGKCTFKRAYYLTWATGQCGRKDTNWTRNAGATQAICKTTATKWVNDRSSAHGSNTATTWTSWKSTTADATKCPASNTIGGQCSVGNTPSANFDKISAKEGEYGNAATVEQCTGAGLGATSATTSTAWVGTTTAARATECDAYWNAFETAMHAECDRQAALWAHVKTVDDDAAIAAAAKDGYKDAAIYTTVGAGNYAAVVTAAMADNGKTGTEKVYTFGADAAKLTSRDVVPAFALMASQARTSGSTAEAKAAFGKALCGTETNGTQTTCSADNQTILDAVTAGAAKFLKTTAAPTNAPSPASVIYSFAAFALAAVFAL